VNPDTSKPRRNNNRVTRHDNCPIGDAVPIQSDLTSCDGLDQQACWEFVLCAAYR
jgi:hypothetical protein